MSAWTGAMGSVAGMTTTTQRVALTVYVYFVQSR